MSEVSAARGAADLGADTAQGAVLDVHDAVLGQRGVADLNLLEKVRKLKQLKPQLEIGWDGGANDQNARALAEGGVDVLNCGGYLHGDNPAEAYQIMQKLLA